MGCCAPTKMPPHLGSAALGVPAPAAAQCSPRPASARSRPQPRNRGGTPSWPSWWHGRGERSRWLASLGQRRLDERAGDDAGTPEPILGGLVGLAAFLDDADRLVA